ncbi:uncharacterized protein LOC143298273 isoform X2 [Babylonia areolata]|uniref:uncharacterized protein LOC143298273 isoform X2 n=1 Tax=Babylonia areolata TaxID=304850 RepID=UPI003FD31511
MTSADVVDGGGGGGGKACGREKFCRDDCECRVVEMVAGKRYEKRCLKSETLGENVCGHSGVPVVRMVTGKVGKNRVTRAVNIKPTKKVCPMKFVPVNNAACCSDTDKPGQCSYFVKAGDSLSTDTCTADNDCEGDKKCCVTSLGKICRQPLASVSCTDNFCVPKFTCKDKETGARCCENKPGQCPGPESIMLCNKNSVHKDCVPCGSDEDCLSKLKCCPCNDCRLCLKGRPSSSLCTPVKCTEGQKCFMDKATCITSPCPKVPTCRAYDSVPGQCPSVDDQESNPCKNLRECQNDQDCKSPVLKCCSSNCGDDSRKRCVRTVPTSSCRHVTCPPDMMCYEVFSREKHTVAPMCLENTRHPRREACGGEGPPLLLLVSDRDLEVLNCRTEEEGEGVQGIPCPQGYSCTKTADGSQLSVCCPGKEPICDPPCKKFQNCSVVFVPDCQNPPCNFSKCVSQGKFPELCLLPKKTGGCLGKATEKWYFDVNFLKCRDMSERACGQDDKEINGNNFPTETECQGFCENAFTCPLPSPCKKGKVKVTCASTEYEVSPYSSCSKAQACCQTECGGRQCETPARNVTEA